MAQCSHDCANCELKGNCADEIVKSKPNEASNIKRVIGVLSGKGGVGKSFVTSSIATYLSRNGLSVGILDADVTGPSIPKAFGIKEKAYGENNMIFPARTNGDIKVMSANLLLDNDTDPIIWRGPLLANLVKQFFENVAWGDLDVLLIDMPPGTGDVALTIFQSLPVDDLIIVTSPQDLVSLIVTKAIKMAELMKIHVLGVIENMSYLICPKCAEKINMFGESHLDDFAKEMNFTVLARLPLNSQNTILMDKGEIEKLVLPEIQPVIDIIKGE